MPARDVITCVGPGPGGLSDTVCCNDKFSFSVVLVLLNPVLHYELKGNSGMCSMNFDPDITEFDAKLAAKAAI